MFMRIYHKLRGGGHVHMRVFVGENRGMTLGKAGDLCMTVQEFDEWRLLVERPKFIEFHDEDVPHGKDGWLMARCCKWHMELTDGVGKCSKPMWDGWGMPTGFCDEPAYGPQTPEGKRRYKRYVSSLACLAHGGPPPPPPAGSPDDELNP